MLAAVLALVAVVLVLRGGNEQEPADPGLRVGLAANTQDAGVGPEQDQARALGVRLIREELRWAAVEPRRGQFDDRRYDELFAAAARRGLAVLPLLFKTPAWLAPEGNTLPPSLPAWQRFVGHVVGRYGAGGSFWRAHPALDARLAPTTWEVWNEPYFGYFSRGGVDPAAYARLVRATVRAGRAASPRAGFLAAMELDYVAPDGSTRNWAQDVLAADPTLPAELAGIAVHPYVRGSPLDRSGPAGGRFDRVLELLSLARDHGLRARRPLWLTEIGWATCPRECVTQTEQARFFDELFQRLGRPDLREDTAAVVAYELRDIGGPTPADPLSNFGLLDPQGRRKPAWGVLRRAALAHPGPR